MVLGIEGLIRYVLQGYNGNNTIEQGKRICLLNDKCSVTEHFIKTFTSSIWCID